MGSLYVISASNLVSKPVRLCVILLFFFLLLRRVLLRQVNGVCSLGVRCCSVDLACTAYLYL